MSDRMTADELMAARLNALERRIEQLEISTGADEDGLSDHSTASVVEVLLAQEKVIRHLLRLLDFSTPDFSISRFRETLKSVDAAKADPLSANWSTEFAEDVQGVIERLIPVPVPRGEPEKRPGTFRPTLVSPGPRDKEPPATT